MKKDPKTYLEELKNCVLPRHKKMIECVRLNGDPKDDILTDIYNDIDNEKKKLMSEFTSFYITKKDNTSPKEMFKLIFNMVLRIKRLILIYKPNIYKSVSANRSGGRVKYNMYKLNWLNNDGKVFTMATRTYGRVGNRGLEKSIPKILEKYFGDALNYYNLYFYPERINNEFVHLKAIINGETWLFIFDNINQNNLGETAVRLELWEVYKKTYQL